MDEIVVAVPNLALAVFAPSEALRPTVVNQSREFGRRTLVWIGILLLSTMGIPILDTGMQWILWNGDVRMALGFATTMGAGGFGSAQLLYLAPLMLIPSQTRIGSVANDIARAVSSVLVMAAMCDMVGAESADQRILVSLGAAFWLGDARATVDWITDTRLDVAFEFAALFAACAAICARRREWIVVATIGIAVLFMRAWSYIRPLVTVAVAVGATISLPLAIAAWSSMGFIPLFAVGAATRLLQIELDPSLVVVLVCRVAYGKARIMRTADERPAIALCLVASFLIHAAVVGATRHIA